MNNQERYYHMISLVNAWSRLTSSSDPLSSECVSSSRKYSVSSARFRSPIPGYYFYLLLPLPTQPSRGTPKQVSPSRLNNIFHKCRNPIFLVALCAYNTLCREKCYLSSTAAALVLAGLHVLLSRLREKADCASLFILVDRLQRGMHDNVRCRAVKKSCQSVCWLWSWSATS